MKAIIFSAGLGTRFKPWTDTHPKALAVVNGKPLLQHNIEYLQQFGIFDVIVNVHHFADQVLAALKDNNGWGSNILISNEQDELLETGGGLFKASSLLAGYDFVTVNVDILTDLDLGKMIAAHKTAGNLITLAIAERDTTRFLLFNKENRLCGWRNTNPLREKIVLQAVEYIQRGYSGIATFNSRVPELIPFTGKFSLIDVYLHLAPDYKIFGYDHTGDRFIDVGKPESVDKAEKLFSR